MYMGDMLIELNKKNDLSINEEVEISVSSEVKDIINYKFIEGYEGVWNSIQDYSTKQKCTWTPKNVGRYMIMVLGERKYSSKPYSERINVVVNDKVRLIKDVQFEKNKLYIGDKLNITVVSDEELLLYRFWIKGEVDWEPLRDYGTDNVFNFTANNSGEKEILIECKRIDSSNNVDDFTVIKYLFNKYNIYFDFDKEFKSVDIQKEYEKDMNTSIGLKKLEKIFEIYREGDVISGSNLAKTFHKVLKDKEYIERMPKEKIETILLYNEQDVVNLYKIFITWKDYIKSKDEEIKINIDEEDIEIDKEEINANRFIQEDKEEIEATEVEKVQDCIVD